MYSFTPNGRRRGLHAVVIVDLTASVLLWTSATAGGSYGRIQEVGDTYFISSVDGSVKLKVDKNSVYPSAADASTDANNSTVSKG